MIIFGHVLMRQLKRAIVLRCFILKQTPCQISDDKRKKPTDGQRYE